MAEQVAEMPKVAEEPQAKKKKKFHLKGKLPKMNITVLKRNTRYGNMDKGFLVIIAALLVIGIITMFSASYVDAINDGESGDFYAKRQIIFAIIGVIFMLIFSFVDYHFFLNPIVSYGSYIIAVILLVVVLIAGSESNGAERWFDFGPIRFQPSELAKIGIIIIFSYYMEHFSKNIPFFVKGLLPMMIMLGIVGVLLLLQPHLSCTIIICIIAMNIVFTGGIRKKHFFLILIIAAVAGTVAYLILHNHFSYIDERLAMWKDPFSEDVNDQTAQSVIAIGSGGIFGLGLGESRQKYGFIPESQNDFVFSIICEELGLIGALSIVLLFMVFIIRGIYIATHAQDKGGMLLAVGITTHIGLQAFLNMAVVSNLIPNTGISLPFFSYGGTALILQLFEMGIMLNISRSRYVCKKKKKKKELTPEELEQIQEEEEIEAELRSQWSSKKMKQERG